MVRSREQIETLKQAIRDRLGIKHMISTSITTVKGTFIICKRVRKVPFYYRGPNRSKTSQTARHAFRFTDKAEADTTCKEINAKRKGGHKFRVENAEKHFVNNFNVSLNYNNQIIVSNELKSIQHVMRGHKATHSINHKKDGIVKELDGRIARLKTEMDNERTAFEQGMKNRQIEIESLAKLQQTVITTDLDKDYVEPNLTATDKTVNVLYGSKTKETESNQQMILLGR